ncbi:MAG: PASTA domain-containing protein [Actinobacteria bacterium]|nr:PASTA domain-containing protein [Actinomycetota bacterium]MCL5069445.1 PASTA domain-containing protein [Actinomycetota bacterium]
MTQNNLDKQDRNILDSRLTDTLIANRYKIIEKIASGGMADVYLGYDSKLERKVALKILHENYANSKNFVNRFKSEAQILSKLNNPNIVMVYDWGEFEGLYFIAMEYIQGKSLKETIEKKGALNPETIVNYSMQICNALEVAHNNNLIHRDIKPQNILITAEGMVKVADFGIAKSTIADITKTMNIVGTAHYVSPEQAQGKVLDFRTDIYSLGIVMYEMLTADLPFRGSNSIDISLRHISEQPTLPSKIIFNVPEKLEKIIMKCLEKNPSYRYPSITSLKKDLQNFLDKKPLIIEKRNSDENHIKEWALTYSKSRRAKVLWTFLCLNIFFMVLFVVFLTLFLSINSRYKNIKTEIGFMIVPPIERINVNEAKEILSTYGLKLVIKSSEFNSNISQNYIISQDPQPGNKIPKDSSVNVVLSKGLETVLVKVPNLIGLTKQDAIKTIEDLGLKAGSISEENSSDFVKDTIINQNPSYNEEIDKNSIINLTVSMGNKILTIPNLIGSDFLYAKAQIEMLGLKLSTTKMTDAASPPGTIIALNPPPGSQVEENSIVELIIATNLEFIPTPDLIGMSLTNAVNLLNEKGIIFEISYIQTDYSVQKDTILEQDPQPGTTLQPGGAMILFAGK